MKNASNSLLLWRPLTIVLLLSVTLAACGFKLRGAYELPTGLQKIYLTGANNSELVRDLKEMLAYSAEVVDSREDADAVLSIDKEESDSRTLSVDSRGKVRESELQYSVIYSVTKLDGEVLIDKDALLLVRDFINDENDVIGRSNESALISKELKRDAAQQILRRLQALKATHSAP